MIPLDYKVHLKSKIFKYYISTWSYVHLYKQNNCNSPETKIRMPF